MTSFALGTPHAPWAPGRKESFDRLTEALESSCPPVPLTTRVFADREPNCVWSEKMWKWAAYTGATHFVTIQDDIEVAPRFWDILTAMVQAKPDAVWGLHSPRGLTPTKASVYASSDGLIGTAYCIRTAMLRKFLPWRQRIPLRVREGMVDQGFGEDSLLGLWCYSQGIPILHPRPSFIRHQTGLTSTYGNDSNASRQPAYPLDFSDEKSIAEMSTPGYWQAEPGPAERFYVTTHTSLIRYTHPEVHEQMLRGETELREQRLRRAVYAHGGEERKPRIKIAVPRRDGWITDLCARTILGLTKWSEVDWMPSSFYDYDVDVARAYIVRDFLKTDGTHLLWIDSKVGFGPELAAGLLRACLLGKHDYVAAPYARSMSLPGPTRWSVRLLDPEGELPPPDEWGCSEVAGAGLGCTLVTRAMLEKMVSEYGDHGGEEGKGQWFKNPGQEPALDLFARDLGLLGDDSKPSEDYAFGARWRSLGGRVMLYRGNGAPAQHASMTTWGGQAGPPLVGAQ